MHARKLLAGLATAAVAASGIALTAAPAQAAVQPNDTTFAPVAADLVGMGSDTTQEVVKAAADAYNATQPASRVATYQAGTGDTVAIPSGSTNRVNGSGDGKKLLYGTGNVADIDFARSSSGLNTAEVGAGLQAFPFALDTIQIAKAATSNAPDTLTGAQILAIYERVDAEGDPVNSWDDLGFTSTAAITAYIPQAGSGTRSFFEGELTKLNGGTAVSTTGLPTTQEHSVADIQGNPNAVVPFSAGRAARAPQVKLAAGWKADRAVYNVVRGSDIGKPEVQDVFGTGGFLCSTEAKPLIEGAGFKQFATPAKGGVCGTTTQAATTDFDLNDATPVDTTTAVAVASDAAGKARITAKIAGGTTPSGSVSFFKADGTVLSRNVAVAGGQASFSVDSALGAQNFRAVYRPAAGTNFKSSQGTGVGTVKTSSTLKVTFPKKAAKAGKKVKGTVKVTLAGVSSKATGTVKVLKGKKTIARVKLVNGKAKITLKKGLKSGVNKLKVVWSGDANAVGSQKAAKVKVAKAKKK
ncbi:Ig-like domain repeat protein [Nocardioides sp. W7]|uniref:PstS family phosphate ABC transporter substrate-binding protein n=1 Tax=Nocardioides sp. W7 TaxID=2931390 RepID=UPI001FD595FA|nr:Ig-like domain repeat protein [Nocardioides sp. W7]